jgi:hypothetical protein
MSAEVRTWIEAQARYHCATISAVVVMAIREKMERDAAKDRKPAVSPE